MKYAKIGSSFTKSEVDPKARQCKDTTRFPRSRMSVYIGSEGAEGVNGELKLCATYPVEYRGLNISHDGGSYHRKPEWPEAGHINRFSDDMSNSLLPGGWIDR